MKKKKDKSRLLTVSVVSFLLLVFVAGFIYGLSSVLAMEGAYPPVVNAASLTEIPDTKEAFADYLNRIVKRTKDEKPAMENGDSFSIDKDSLVTDGDESFKKTLLFIRDGSGRDSFDKYLEDRYGDRKVEFGADSSEVFVSPDITVDDIVDFHCGSLGYKCDKCGNTQSIYTDFCRSCDENGRIESTFTSYIYYQCPSCGEKSSEPKENCELCGGVQPYSEKYSDEYEFTVEVDTDNDELMKRLFGKRTDAEIRELIGDELKDTVNIEKIDTDYTKAYIIFKVNRLTDELKYVEYRKEIAVSAVGEFINGFAELGTKNVSFTLTEKNNYKITWPSLVLSEHEMTVEPHGNNNLLATLTCDDATKYTVTWSSSDEDILTVDDEGYFKAGKKEGSAVISASFEFNGKVYTDECTVHIRYSVESSKMSKTKLKLNVGETYKLEAKLSPKKATVKTVKWYTDDASIADVDENGVVTAKSAGTVTVYSLSDDGYFRSSCEVTVK